MDPKKGGSMMHCISLWKAAVIYVLSIFMSAYLTVPKINMCVAKVTFVHAIVKTASPEPLGPPAPEKQEGKVFLLIVGIIAAFVAAVIIYGIWSMAKRI